MLRRNPRLGMDVVWTALAVAVAIGLVRDAGRSQPAVAPRQETIIPRAAPAPRVGLPAPLPLRKVVIDPGHGGPDGGARASDGTAEEGIVLDVARAAAAVLREAGVEVILTREDDRDLSGLPQGARLSDRKRADLAERLRIGNESGADAFVSVHANSFGVTWRGAQTFHPPRRPEAARLARAVQDALIEVAGHTDREPNQRVETYLMERMTIPVITVEVGFLSNAEDLRLLSDPGHRQRLGKGIALGIARFFLEASLPGPAAGTTGGREMHIDSRI